MANIKWKSINLDNIKADKIDELDAACEATILGRFTATVNGVSYEFSYDEKAQSRFNGVGLMFTRGIITSNDWTAYLNGERVRISLSSNDFNNVAIAAAQHCDSNVQKFNDLRTQVLDPTCDTPDKVRAITW